MKTITFLRHGKTKLSDELSDIGIEQAKKRSYNLRDLFPFDLVIASSALRTKETAKIITKTLNLNIPRVILKELYLPCDDKDKVIIENMLDKLGSVPLYEYIKHDKENAWKRYAKDAYEALLNCIHEHNAKNILVIGHGNIINSLGLMINPKALELPKIYFECLEGFTIFEETKDIRYYKKNRIMYGKT